VFSFLLRIILVIRDNTLNFSKAFIRVNYCNLVLHSCLVSLFLMNY